jgi:hypothetical protein
MAMKTVLTRWWFWTAAILLGAGIATGALFLSAGQSKITQANFDRIQEGMTRAEVEEILGKETLEIAFVPSLHHAGATDVLYWIDGPTKICIHFCPDFPRDPLE